TAPIKRSPIRDSTAILDALMVPRGLSRHSPPGLYSNAPENIAGDSRRQTLEYDALTNDELSLTRLRPAAPDRPASEGGPCAGTRGRNVNYVGAHNRPPCRTSLSPSRRICTGRCAATPRSNGARSCAETSRTRSALSRPWTAWFPEAS